jgi:hypothetical protein
MQVIPRVRANAGTKAKLIQKNKIIDEEYVEKEWLIFWQIPEIGERAAGYFARLRARAAGQARRRNGGGARAACAGPGCVRP